MIVRDRVLATGTLSGLVLTFTTQGVTMSSETIGLLFGLIIGILSGVYGTTIALSLGGVL